MMLLTTSKKMLKITLDCRTIVKHLDVNDVLWVTPPKGNSAEISGQYKRSKKPLHMEIHLLVSIYYLQEEIFVQDGASFQSIPVTRPVVTQCTTRY